MITKAEYDELVLAVEHTVALKVDVDVNRALAVLARELEPPLHIRFMASTDGSLAMLAYAYLNALVDSKIAPVRLCTLDHGVSSAFSKFQPQLYTPTQTTRMVNVVCAPPERWTWLLKISIPESANATQPAENASQWVHLRSPAPTRNVLLVNALPPSKKQLAEALKYDYVFLAVGGALAQWWEQAAADLGPSAVVRVVPPSTLPEVLDHIAHAQRI